MNKALLYDEVERIVGKPIQLVRVKNHQLLYQILSDNNIKGVVRILLHYQNSGDANIIGGHWCAMIIDKTNKIILYYDSYGGKVDASLSHISPHKRLEYDENDMFIDKFLAYAMNHGYSIHYNDHPHQSREKGINTCGRYSACFLKYAHSIDQFHRYLYNYAVHNNCVSFDHAIVKLTQRYLK